MTPSCPTAVKRDQKEMPRAHFGLQMRSRYFVRDPVRVNYTVPIQLKDGRGVNLVTRSDFRAQAEPIACEKGERHQLSQGSSLVGCFDLGLLFGGSWSSVEAPGFPCSKWRTS